MLFEINIPNAILHEDEVLRCCSLHTFIYVELRMAHHFVVSFLELKKKKQITLIDGATFYEVISSKLVLYDSWCNTKARNETLQNSTYIIFQ